jgi:hypothetical protein
MFEAASGDDGLFRKIVGRAAEDCAGAAKYRGERLRGNSFLRLASREASHRHCYLRLFFLVPLVSQPKRISSIQLPCHF